MNLRLIETDNTKIAVVENSGTLVMDGQSALDLAATIHYGCDSQNVIIPKAAICEDFFKLSTGIAGEVAQKFVNYGFRVVIVGNFSGYTSKPLRDYIYECNKGRHINFASTESEAIEKFSK